MDYFTLIGIALVTVVAAMIVKPIKPEIAIIIGVIGGCLILLECVDYLVAIIDKFTEIATSSGIDLGLLKMILKIVGVGYLTEFAANICIDSGNASVADKLLFAGKIIILFIALPIISAIIEIIIGIMP